MIKQDLVEQIVMRTGLDRARTEMAVEAMFKAMKQAMIKGERIELRGFGVFTIKARKGGVGRNPKTGQAAPYAVVKGIRFKPGKGLETDIPSDGHAQKE